MGTIVGPGNQSYTEFYFKWIEDQEQQLHDMQSVLKQEEPEVREKNLQQVISEVIKHYRKYYEVKESAAKQNVLEIMSPKWKSPLENAFMWIGGWRPTMVFRLVYAETGQQLESELALLLNGIDTPSMASLTSTQLSKIHHLQEQTQEVEDDLSYRMAVLQQAMTDQPLVALAQIEMCGGVNSQGNSGSSASIMTAAVDDKLKELEELLIEADNLRFDTLFQMLKLLTPFQAVQYLVAAAQLQRALRNIGKQKLQASGLEGNNGEAEDEEI
eukprot:c22248_g1_i1 orf=128-940(+)